MDNELAINTVKEFEGLELKVYLDSADLPTVGYGHLVTRGDGLRVGDIILQSQADAFLEHDMQTAIDGVDTLVRVPLNDNQRAALISFTYNLGEGALKGSTLLRKLNAGDYAGCADELLKWTRAGGKVVQGLVNRRNKERALFETPVE